jgi:hypothetical protein
MRGVVPEQHHGVPGATESRLRHRTAVFARMGRHAAGKAIDRIEAGVAALLVLL